VKRRLGDLQGALADLNRADELEPSNNFTLRVRGNVKKCLGDNEGALTDLTMAELLEHTTTTTEGSLFRRTPTRTASSKVTTSDENQVRSQFASEVASCSTPGSK
jgi:hypothetical protein